jgi:hypothetical protein
MNPTESSDAAREARARAYIHDLRAFYRLAGTAALVLVITFTINYVTNPDRWWALWVAFGFGVALAFSGVKLLLKGRLFGADWEERKVREYLDRNPR